MNYAIINSGKVVNVAVAEPSFAAAQGWIAITSGVGVGWRYEGATFLPPSEPAPPPNYIAFWDALLTSAVYGSIRTQSMASLPMNTLATEFIALIGDAKAGRPNEAAIQASMSAVFATGTFTTADAAEFTAALAAGSLDDIYSLSTGP